MRIPGFPRRALLASLAPGGCAAPLPEMSGRVATPEAKALLDASARAHGADAFAALGDINVRYDGQWRGLVGTLQPALVDRGFRGGSEERMLPRAGWAAQAHTGPEGRKQVVRRTAHAAEGEVRVWFNGSEARDTERRAAAALVADGYALFLLGPILLADVWYKQRSLALELGRPEFITQDGRERACDVLRVRLAPGLGFSASDHLALYIDREDRLMRKVRFTLNGLESTRGAVAEVDAFDHVTRHGVRWPTRFHEQLLRPLPLPVHDWRLTGLDVNRGLEPREIDNATFTGRATRVADALA